MLVRLMIPTCPGGVFTNEWANYLVLVLLQERLEAAQAHVADLPRNPYFNSYLWRNKSRPSCAPHLMPTPNATSMPKVRMPTPMLKPRMPTPMLKPRMPTPMPTPRLVRPKYVPMRLVPKNSPMPKPKLTPRPTAVPKSSPIPSTEAHTEAVSISTDSDLEEMEWELSTFGYYLVPP